MDFKHNCIILPKIKQVKAKLHRSFHGTVKSITVSKTSTGKYFASVLVDDSVAKIPTQTYTEETTIGINMGLKSFAVLSDGTKIAPPKFLLKLESRLKRAQRNLSKKLKGSSNKIKAKKRLAILHEKVANQRNDFLHKLSRKLVDENQAVAFEQLNVTGMLKNHKLAKSISDASWSKFKTFCTYKANWYCKTILECDRFDPTSKLCPNCGTIYADLKLSDRTWTCTCGTTHDRDLNAANNIKNLALSRAGMAQTQACGVVVRPDNCQAGHVEAGNRRL